MSSFSASQEELDFPLVTVAGVQMKPKVGRKAENLESTLRFIEAAADQGAQLIVLPELSNSGYQERLQGKIDKLESTIKSRRQLEKAIRVLVETQGLSETKAYEYMRERATSMRVTVAEIAGLILDTHDAMEKLGFAKDPSKRR